MIIKWTSYCKRKLSFTELQKRFKKCEAKNGDYATLIMKGKIWTLRYADGNWYYISEEKLTYPDVQVIKKLKLPKIKGE